MDRSVQLTAIISAAIIVISLTALAVALVPEEMKAKSSSYTGTKKEFWLFNSGIPDFNETEEGMPHDVYSKPVIEVYKGDNVTIHFFNTEEPGGDRHSFTMNKGPYKFNVILDPGMNKTISFQANTAGIFPYYCIFHQPTMRGELVVENPPSPYGRE